MTRITTNGMLFNYRYNLMTTTNQLNKAMTQVMTQRSFSTYAENPAGATRAFKIHSSLNATRAQYGEATALEALLGWLYQKGRRDPIKALIRAKNIDVFSTNRGYVLNDKQEYSRILKVKHEDDEVEAELGAIVDMGGWIRDVFVYHKVYGVIRAEMNIHSRRDIRKYLEEIANGKSSLLMNVTSGYHYHTIVADDEQTLDLIQEELGKLGFLAKLQEYEPVDFWHKG